MKVYIAIFFTLLIACEGRLTDEQRKKMKEQMELHKIRRVTDSQITEAAYKEGRRIMNIVGGSAPTSLKVDSLQKSVGIKMHFIVPGDSNVHFLEQQLIDAYIADMSGSLQDNVQELRNGTVKSDSILYSKPVITKLPDGSERLEGIWNIWLSRKQIVLSID